MLPTLTFSEKYSSLKMLNVLNNLDLCIRACTLIAIDYRKCYSY